MRASDGHRSLLSEREKCRATLILVLEPDAPPRPAIFPRGRCRSLCNDRPLRGGAVFGATHRDPNCGVADNQVLVRRSLRFGGLDEIRASTTASGTSPICCELRRSARNETRRDCSPGSRILTSARHTPIGEVGTGTDDPVCRLSRSWRRAT